jgi:hypothetical protein
VFHSWKKIIIVSEKQKLAELNVYLEANVKRKM